MCELSGVEVVRTEVRLLLSLSHQHVDTIASSNLCVSRFLTDSALIGNSKRILNASLILGRVALDALVSRRIQVVREYFTTLRGTVILTPLNVKKRS